MRLIDTRSKRRLISLTPLIDVVFILLLFFMLSTQFTRQKAMTLNVPADNGPVNPDDDAPLTLHLSDRGDILIANDEIVTVESLVTHAALQIAIDRKTTIRLDADDAAPLQLLVTVADLLEHAGASSVQLTALRQP